MIGKFVKTSELIKQLEDYKKSMIIYIHSKLDIEDFHAVADAANDIREIDAKLSILRLK